ncbi:hypothetical protein HRR86_007111 [Exophiala dermatitidis]|uniref:Uncharacterized protein n=1 Tax=Exophiala dermatitidis (strain ATCC 34100 / CBS 525.76 / NIH/UT8656) TaxID=858893 RepID=H6BWE1_EXODN|nr:uncharacterized protein HMPREF1120_04161 [Exophiala dermatitidis NIH/UT8656]EHY56057.1 hypothetical protein HMPREF1120_04161 [Exophiala dermatitidis NIH/UT8656]KAJ4618545.1 hypothetical protein HRR86_007111 [Exophiala dermatitidis]
MKCSQRCQSDGLNQSTDSLTFVYCTIRIKNRRCDHPTIQQSAYRNIQRRQEAEADWNRLMSVLQGDVYSTWKFSKNTANTLRSSEKQTGKANMLTFKLQGSLYSP